MMDEEFEDELVDEVLSNDFMTSDIDEDALYERWRDDQCDALYDALKEVYDTFVHAAKHGYYKDRNEKFLEHSVEHLKYFTECDLTAIEHNVTAVKREPKKVVFVETFKEEKNEVSPKIKS